VFSNDPIALATFWGPVAAALVMLWSARSANRRDRVQRFPPGYSEIESLKTVLNSVMSYNKHLQEANEKLTADLTQRDLQISKYVSEIRRLRRNTISKPERKR
jgi:predicted RNase H-like nuclease (RuvC/YqgF family)